MVPELGPPTASGRGAAAETAGAAACGAAVSAGAGIVEGPGLRACAGAAACEPATAGAVTGAVEFGFSPGVYTGGSSRTVYSRINRPRAQFTSTREVTNGSGMVPDDRHHRSPTPADARNV